MSAQSTALAGLLVLRPCAVLRPARIATPSTARAVSTVSTTARPAAYANSYLAACRRVPSLRRAPVSRAAAASTTTLGRRCQSSETSAKDTTGTTGTTGGTEKKTKSKKKEKAAAVNGESRNSSDDAVSEDRSLTTLRIKELSEAGVLNYPRYQLAVDDEDCRLSVPEFRARFASIPKPSEGGAPEAAAASASAETPRVEIAGRVLAVRRMGSKLAFVRLLDEGQQVQVMCNLRKFGSEFIAPGDAAPGVTLVSVAEFKNAMRLLNRGDHVSFTGYAMRTPTGELTLDADAMPRVYTPALAPLPARLSDGDTRALRRHLDLLVNTELAATLRLRSQIVREMRAFLEDQRFVEVQTPILADLAGGAAARPFVTSHGDAAAGGQDQPPSRNLLSMRIAPELWLKRLVVGGLDRVFEIGPSFRNEGIDATHNPEFTMCEFYAAYWTLPTLMYKTELLLAQLARSAITFRRQQASQLPTDSYISPEKLSASVNRIAAGPPFLQLEFIPALQEALGFTLPDLSAPDAYDQLRQRLAAHGHAAVAGAEEVSDADGGRLAKLLDRLAGTHLEPRSVTDPYGRPLGPLFIMHHPACMSPLAKCFVCPRTGQTVAARAELFVDGRELANMYEEENDPAEQRRKMQLQAQEQAGDNSDSSVDENYIAALESGLPPTGGWGCGIERLVMLMTGAPRISDCLSFGTLQHVMAMKR